MVPCRRIRYLVPLYSQEHNLFYVYAEHFALFASFAVNDFFHRKERKVRKDNLNCLVFNYKPNPFRILIPDLANFFHGCNK